MTNAIYQEEIRGDPQGLNPTQFRTTGMYASPGLPAVLGTSTRIPEQSR